MSVAWGFGATLAMVAYCLTKRVQQKKAARAEAGKATDTTATTAAASSTGAAAAAASSSAPAAKAAASRTTKHAAGKLKMVLVVRNDLGMGKGKMMAQCCHAAVGVVRDMMDDEEDIDVVDRWDNGGAMKIALKANSEAELEELEAKADALDLPSYLVVDAGHTQIAPDTKTVLAIGPAPAKLIDIICGHLKLM